MFTSIRWFMVKDFTTRMNNIYTLHIKPNRYLLHCKLNYHKLSINITQAFIPYFQASFFFIFPLMKNEAKNLGFEVKS